MLAIVQLVGLDHLSHVAFADRPPQFSKSLPVRRLQLFGVPVFFVSHLGK